MLSGTDREALTFYYTYASEFSIETGLLRDMAKEHMEDLSGSARILFLKRLGMIHAAEVEKEIEEARERARREHAKT